MEIAMDPESAQWIVEMRISQIKAFKEAIKLMSQNVSECVFDICGTGMHTMRLNEDRSILIKIDLGASNFEYFRCDEEKISIGIDLPTLHTGFREMGNYGHIVLFIKQADRGSLYVRYVDKSSQRLRPLGRTSQRLRPSERTGSFIKEVQIGIIPDIQQYKLPVPNVAFAYSVNIPRETLHKICRKIAKKSLGIGICCNSDKIFFAGIAPCTKIYRYVYNDEKSGKSFIDAYDITTLYRFTKCDMMTDVLTMHFKDNWPLQLDIPISTLGMMQVYMTQFEESYFERLVTGEIHSEEE